MAHRLADGIRRHRRPLAAAAAAVALGVGAPAFGAFDFLGGWGTGGKGDGQLGRHISGIAVDPSGTVYVVDRDGDRIQRFSTSGAFLGSWTSPGLHEPAAAAVTPAGNLLVGDDGSVRAFTAAGTELSKWPVRFGDVAGIAVASDGTVYVTEHDRHGVGRFTGAGEPRGRFGAEQVDDPRGVAVGRDGQVYVAEDDLIHRFSAAGESLGRWKVEDPQGLATDGAGDVFAASAEDDRVVRFTATGAPAGELGRTGATQARLHEPRGVAVDCRGNVYVTDESDPRVHKFGEVGAPPPPCTEPGPTLGSTARAQAVSGGVVVHTGREVQRLTRRTLIPIGSTVDASRGRVRLEFETAAADQDQYGPVQSGDFSDGEFTIHQSRSASLVELRLDETQDRVAKAGARSAAARPRRARRVRVWGQAHGRFRTTGRHGAGTIRGTRWLTEETARGTLFKVQEGVVEVREFASGRVVAVRAGESFLAKPKCVSRRNFTIRILTPVGTRLRSAEVTVHGRRVAVRPGPRYTARIDLRLVPKGRFVVHIRVVTADGLRLAGRRTYHTCRDRLPGGPLPIL